MKFLVTGGAGFIGSYICENLLERGFSVICVDNLSTGRLSNLESAKSYQSFEFISGDILQPEDWRECVANVSHIIHMAGIGEIVPSIVDPLAYVQTNVIGTSYMLELARALNVASFVYAASSSCYGLASGPTDESAAIDLRHPYSLSKYLGEQTVLSWYSIYGLPTKSIRIFNAFGRKVRTTGSYGAVLGVFLKQKLSGEPLTVVGDGKQSRDFVHARDVAEAFVLAALSPIKGRVWNLGSGNPIYIEDLVAILGGPHVHIPDRPGEPRSTHADIKLISQDLGWQPRVSFSDGIAEILANIDEWKDAPLWTPKSIAQATKEWFDVLGTGAS